MVGMRTGGVYDRHNDGEQFQVAQHVGDELTMLL